MRPDFVVVTPPGTNDFSGFSQIPESVLIQAAVSETAVEARGGPRGGPISWDTDSGFLSGRAAG
jgi:hypothetical protein